MAVTHFPAIPIQLASGNRGAAIRFDDLPPSEDGMRTVSDVEAHVLGQLAEIHSHSGKNWLARIDGVESIDDARDQVIIKTFSSRRVPSRLRGRYVVALRKSNPRKKVGGGGWKSYQLLLDHGGVLSVEEYYALGGRTNDIDWDVGHEFVELTDVPPVHSMAKTDEEIAAAEGPQDFEVDGEILPTEFHHILNLAKIGQNILLVGPSGSGKTFLAAKIAEKLGRPFAAQSCSAGMSESQLAGWLLPIEKSGKFAYVPSAFVRMYEEGGVFLFDEVDAADENTLIFINAALANGSFYLPQRFDNPKVTRHPDFVSVAVANTYGLGESMIYSGRNQLDGATLDRFRAGVVFVDYSERVEKKLVDPEVYTWGLKVRMAIRNHSLERIMSTRVMLDFTKQKVELGYGRDQWEASYFADWTPDERMLAA